MLTLQPVRFPRPVPIPRWTDNYADIGERIARDGWLDTEEVWLPQSGDGWASFCGRHGVVYFNHQWVDGLFQEVDAPSPRQIAIRRGLETRRRAEVARQQEAFEAERREYQAKKQRQADELWAAEEQRQAAERAAIARRPTMAQVEIDEGRAWWVLRNPGYANQPFFQVVAPKNGIIDGFQFWAGNTYVVPATIMAMLR